MKLLFQAIFVFLHTQLFASHDSVCRIIPWQSDTVFVIVTDSHTVGVRDESKWLVQPIYVAVGDVDLGRKLICARKFPIDSIIDYNTALSDDHFTTGCFGVYDFDGNEKVPEVIDGAVSLFKNFEIVNCRSYYDNHFDSHILLQNGLPYWPYTSYHEIAFLFDSLTFLVKVGEKFGVRRIDGHWLVKPTFTGYAMGDSCVGLFNEAPFSGASLNTLIRVDYGDKVKVYDNWPNWIQFLNDISHMEMETIFEQYDLFIPRSEEDVIFYESWVATRIRNLARDHIEPASREYTIARRFDGYASYIDLMINFSGGYSTFFSNTTHSTYKSGNSTYCESEKYSSNGLPNEDSWCNCKQFVEDTLILLELDDVLREECQDTLLSKLKSHGWKVHDSIPANDILTEMSQAWGIENESFIIYAGHCTYGRVSDETYFAEDLFSVEFSELPGCFIHESMRRDALMKKIAKDQ